MGGLAMMFDLSTQLITERINNSFRPLAYTRYAARLLQSCLDASEYILTYTTKVARIDDRISCSFLYVRSVTSTVYIVIVGDVHSGLASHFDADV